MLLKFPQLSPGQHYIYISDFLCYKFSGSANIQGWTKNVILLKLC